MKQIISVSVGTRKGQFDKTKTGLLCIGLFADGRRPARLYAGLDKRLGGAISRALKLGDFSGKAGESVLLYGNGQVPAERILLVGLGEKKKVDLDVVRRAATVVADRAVSLKVAEMVLALHQLAAGKVSPAQLGRAIAEGVYYGGYRYDEFVSSEEDGRLKSLKAHVVEPDGAVLRKLADGVSLGGVVGGAQSYARTIANRPGNVINPTALAAEARRLARTTPGLSCTVFDEKQLRQKKMGGILAVGSGSANKPRLIILKYNPGRAAGKGPTVALVGKAITFDSGGISIKPAKQMDQMKLDKSGGLAVLGTMKAVASLKPPVTVYGIIPSAENLPSATSYRPGDIVTTFSGKTVEVQNTDAEGRMILCDALAWADKQSCDVIVDIATLTGACKVALGKYMAGLMGNDEKLIKQLQAASKESGEKLWHLPSGEEYLEEMKSKIADLKNIGSAAGWGGACTAAAFLGQFVGKRKWAHIDMAGVDIFEGSNNAGGVGATAFGVRLLTSFVLGAAKKR